MEITFYLVQVNGEKVTDMSQYEDAIFEMLAHFTDEHDEVTLGEDSFSISRVPTLSEILAMERKLVKAGLVIEA